MATYQSNTGGYANRGGNSMFNQLNAATLRMQEARQAKRTSDWYAKQDATNLGKISDDFYGSYGKNENIQLGATKNWREHYDDLTGGDMKKMRKIHGAMGTPENLKKHFEKKTSERDLHIMNAIKRKMAEMGTGDLHKVIPKFNEEGGKEFREWYNNANDLTREELRKAGYQPGQKEVAFTPNWIEKRQAQGKSTAPYLTAAGGAGAYGAYMGAGKIKGMMSQLEGTAQGRELIKAEMVRSSGPTRTRIEERIAKYKNQLKTSPGSKKAARNLKRYEKYLKTLDDTGRIPYRMGGGAQMREAKNAVRDQLVKQSKAGLLGKVKGAARYGVGYYGGGQIGGAIESAITGKDDGWVGETVGGLGLPPAVKSLAKSKAGKSLINHIMKSMGKTVLASQAFDAGVPTYVDLGAGVLGAGIGAYNWYKDK